MLLMCMSQVAFAAAISVNPSPPGNVGSGTVFKTWYYAVDNSGDVPLPITLEMWGPGNDYSSSGYLKLTYEVPANTVTIFLYEIYTTGSSSTELSYLGYINTNKSFSNFSNASGGGLAVISMGVHANVAECQISSHPTGGTASSNAAGDHYFKFSVPALDAATIFKSGWTECSGTQRWSAKYKPDKVFPTCCSKAGIPSWYITESNVKVESSNKGSKNTGKQYGNCSITVNEPVITVTKINKPTATDHTYDGTQKTGVSGGTGYTLSGTYQATNAGSYTAYATLQANYAWNDGSTGVLTLNWKISKARLKKPTGNIVERTYNGQDQSPTFNDFDSGKMNVTGNVGKDAGSYTAKITPKGNYEWEDGTTGEVNIQWKIVPKTISVVWGANIFTYNGSAQAPTASASSGIAGETINLTRTTATDAKSGTYTSTASISSVTGGKVSNYKLSNTTKDFTINPKPLTVTWTGATEFTYNGTAQGPTVTSPISGVTGETVYLKVTGQQTNANSPTTPTYTATASIDRVDGGRRLASNYTLQSSTKSFKINKAAISPVVIMNGYEYGKTKSTPSLKAGSNPGNGAVTYYYNKTNSNSNGTQWTSSTNFEPGAYWMYAVVAETANYLGATSPTTKFIVGRAPMITPIVGNTTYKKSQTATITIYDPDKDLPNMDNDQYLKQGSITLQYSWTQSPTAPSTYSQSKTITVAANTSTVTTEITKNTDSGIWYLHVKAVVSDAVGYTATLTSSAAFYLDNTKPTITIINNPSTTYIDDKDTVSIDLYVTDIHAETNADQLALSDINIYVAGTTASATAKLEHIKYDTVNKVRQYRLTLSNVKRTGYITLSIPADAVVDNAGNGNVATSFGIQEINILVDNSIPVITQNGEIKVTSITPGKNLNNKIDPRYINKEYEIEIPILVTDEGTDTATDELQASDITIMIDGAVVTPDKKTLRFDGMTYTENATTKVRTYKRQYTLILKGLKENGYLSYSIKAGAVTDIVGNVNVAGTYEPYTTSNGTGKVSSTKILVDNINPRAYIVVKPNIKSSNGDEVLTFEIRIVDEGAGITSDQFVAGDIVPTINGTTVSPTLKKLTASNKNNYETAKGNGAADNYTYTLEVSGIPGTGTLRFELPANSVVDKANNGIEIVTLPTEIIIDRKGPTIGKVQTNADKNGELVDEETHVWIDDCTDPDSGIGGYTWEVSYDGGKTWEEFYDEDSNLPGSSADHQIEDDGDVLYRVRVRDGNGNETIAEPALVHFRRSLNRRPTIRFDTILDDGKKVEVLVTIKSTTPIVSTVINKNSKQDVSKFEVSRSNYEVTSTFTYTILVNGSYEFEVEDSKGNVTREVFNVSSLDTTSALITYEIKNATSTSKAKIIFKANEEVRIINSASYVGISFNTTDYKTQIEATIEEGADTSKVFVFENRAFKTTEVKVTERIVTKVSSVRFAEPTSESMDVTMQEAFDMANGISSARVEVGGTMESYYGFANSSVNTKLTSGAELSVAEQLGNANKTYTRTVDGTKEELVSSGMASTSSNSSYVNGNVTGMYEKSSGTLDNFDSKVTDSSREYGSFRVTITR